MKTWIKVLIIVAAVVVVFIIARVVLIGKVINTIGDVAKDAAKLTDENPIVKKKAGSTEYYAGDAWWSVGDNPAYERKHKIK